MNKELTNGAIHVLRAIQDVTDAAERAAGEGKSRYEVLAGAYLLANVNLARPRNHEELAVSPLEQAVSNAAPSIAYCEVVETLGKSSLVLYGEGKNESITIGLDATLALFEDAWRNGYLDDLLPEDMADQAGLHPISAKVHRLSLVRERAL